MLTKIVVPLDGSVLAEQAIGPAAAIARVAGATLALIQVHKPVAFGAFEDVRGGVEACKAERAYLEAIEHELGPSACLPVSAAVLRGDPSETIAEYARDVRADLIVMTTHGRTGFSRAWLGSVAHAVLRRSAVPVFLIRANANPVSRRTPARLPRRILVTLDGSELARGILEPVLALARCEKSRLLFLRIVEPASLAAAEPPGPSGLRAMTIDEVTQRLVAEAREHLAGVAASLAMEGFTDLETDVVVASSAAPAILDYARAHAVDAIAMSTHGHGLSRLFVGSVADKVLRACGLPMLLRRPLELESQPFLLNTANIADELPALSGL